MADEQFVYETVKFESSLTQGLLFIVMGVVSAAHDEYTAAVAAMLASIVFVSMGIAFRYEGFNRRFWEFLTEEGVFTYDG